MLTLNVAAIKEGHSTIDGEVSPLDLGLEENEEFNRTIHLHYDINRVGHEVFIDVGFLTTADLQCDVCLEPFLYEINDVIKVILTRESDLGDKEDDDIYMVSDVTREVDITESIRQSLLLDIPLKKKCAEDCKGLCPKCGANLNLKPCDCTHEDIDPRWDALKNINFT